MGFKRLDAAFRKAHIADALTVQGSCCAYCFEPLPRKTATVDHYVPKSGGGTDAKDNLVACCKPCNQSKGSMTEKQFLNAVDTSTSLHFMMIKFRRTLWMTTHESCKRILTRSKATYRGPNLISAKKLLKKIKSNNQYGTMHAKIFR